MDNLKVYGFTIDYVDDLDLMQKAVTLYTTMINVKAGDKYLRPKLAIVLSFYLLHGFSDETKEIILDTLGIKRDNLNQINCELQKKGYLVRDEGNYRKKNLSEKLSGFQEFFTLVKGDNDMDRVIAVKLQKV